MDLNKVQLIGNITNDIELKATPNGKSVCSFGIATNRPYTDGEGNSQDNTQFHNIVLWGKLAEIADKFCHKGKKIYLEGRLQTKIWEDQSGVKKYKTEIIGENLIMLGNNGDNNTPKTNNVAAAAKEKAEKNFVSIEDIPF